MPQHPTRDHLARRLKCQQRNRHEVDPIRAARHGHHDHLLLGPLLPSLRHPVRDHLGADQDGNDEGDDRLHEEGADQAAFTGGAGGAVEGAEAEGAEHVAEDCEEGFRPGEGGGGDGLRGDAEADEDGVPCPVSAGNERVVWEDLVRCMWESRRGLKGVQVRRNVPVCMLTKQDQILYAALSTRPVTKNRHMRMRCVLLGSTSAFIRSLRRVGKLSPASGLRVRGAPLPSAGSCSAISGFVALGDHSGRPLQGGETRLAGEVVTLTS